MNAQVNGTQETPRRIKPAKATNSPDMGIPISTPKPAPKRKNRPRTVFGRRRVVIDGLTYIVEMRADCLAVRRLHARTEQKLPLFDLVQETIRQKTLKL